MYSLPNIFFKRRSETKYVSYLTCEDKTQRKQKEESNDWRPKKKVFWGNWKQKTQFDWMQHRMGERLVWRVTQGQTTMCIFAILH